MQAPADCDIFMSIPAVFSVINGSLQFNNSSSHRDSSDHVLCIKKNIYGLRQAGNNWFDTIGSSLLALGFCQSQHDPCLFIMKDCIILVYVDDCLIFGRSDDVMDTVISNLQKDFVLTSQGSVSAYLGIDICHTPDSHLEFSNPAKLTKSLLLAAFNIGLLLTILHLP